MLKVITASLLMFSGLVAAEGLPILSLTSQPYMGATYVQVYAQTTGYPQSNLTCYAYGPLSGTIQTSCYANINGGTIAYHSGTMTSKEGFYMAQPYGLPSNPQYLIIQAFPQAGHLCFTVSGGVATPITKCGLF